MRSTYYVPLLDGVSRVAFLVLHTSVEPHSVAPEVRQAIQQLDRDMPLFQVRTADEITGSQVEKREFSILLLSLFAGLALLLAAVGLYGVLSYAVSQRTSEIGIRMALGASAAEVRRMILDQGMRPAIAGIAVGVAGAVFATRLLRSMLFGVTAVDPLTFIAVIMSPAGSLGCWLVRCRLFGQRESTQAWR